MALVGGGHDRTRGQTKEGLCGCGRSKDGGHGVKACSAFLSSRRAKEARDGQCSPCRSRLSLLCGLFTTPGACL